jgi:hypothetical protein
MADHEHVTTSEALVAEINAGIEIVTAEISMRTNAPSDAETLKRSRRLISAKTATLSDAAGIACTAARQLADARTRILDEIARAEAAGFIVGEDFSVGDSARLSTHSSRARDHAAAIQAAVITFSTLDRRVTSRLRASGNALADLRDN